MDPRTDYVLRTFGLYYQADLNLIDYGGNNNKGPIVIKKSRAFDTNDVKVDLDNIVWEEWNGSLIPFLFDKKANQIFTNENGKITINYDLVASAFFLLSGYQELSHNNRDDLGRFKFTESIQYKLGITTLPVVNYYFDILKTAFGTILQVPVKTRFIPENGYTACLTHDIDNCENAWIEGSFSALKKGDFLTPFKLLFHKFILGKDQWFNFDEIISIEKSFEARSSFYFLCRKGKFRGKSNADYDITKKKFAAVKANIISNGSECGIHGSFGTHTSSKLLKEDIKKLNSQVWGGRFHFLEFDMHTTPTVLEETGLKYDSTLGFAEHPGFRNSFCYPFYLFDFKNVRTSKVLEIPLILMDSSLQSKNYLHFTPGESFKMIDDIISEIKKYNGVFTILWHSTLFSDYKYKGWKDVYIYFLNQCKKDRVEMVSGLEIAGKFLNHEI